MSEEMLIGLIYQNNPKKNFREACLYKEKIVTKDYLKRNRIIIIRIILLLYTLGNFNFGKYLSPYKSELIKLLHNAYVNPPASIHLYKYLINMDKYGFFLKFLEEAKELNDDWICDFFRLLLDEKNLLEVLNKYFYNIIGKYLPSNVMINSVDDLKELIDRSLCLKNNRYDFKILYDFIISKDEFRKSKKKKFSKDLPVDTNIPYSKEKLEEKNVIETQEDKTSRDIQTSISCDNSSSNNEKKSNESAYTIKADDKNKKHDKKFSSFNKEINTINNIKEETNLLINYYKERKQYFSGKGYQTPFLDKIINENINIEIGLFSLKKPKKDYLFSPHYINLVKIIDVFNNPANLKKHVLEEKKYGYFCYRKYKEGKYIYREGLYGTLDNSIVYNEITNKSKFEKDDINEEDKVIVDNTFYARGLSLEYYINGLFMDLLDEKEELPRVIYNFDLTLLEENKDEAPNMNKNVQSKEKQANKIIDFKKEKKENPEFQHKKREEEEKVKNSKDNEKINEKQNSDKTMEMEEIDGVFYFKEEMRLNLKELPFIIDDVLGMEGSKFDFVAQDSNYLEVRKNTLVLIEVKNRFPKKIELEQEIKIACSKAWTFYDFYTEKYQNMEKIRIMFFYDTIPMKNYSDILLNTMKNYFKRDEELQKKMEFQIIFITSSYLAYNFKKFTDEINTLKTEVTTLKNNNKNLNDKFEIIERITKSYYKDLKELKEKMTLTQNEEVYPKNENKYLKLLNNISINQKEYENVPKYIKMYCEKQKRAKSCGKLLHKNTFKYLF